MPPPPKRVKKVMTLPINVIFQHLQVKSTTTNPQKSCLLQFSTSHFHYCYIFRVILDLYILGGRQSQ